MKHLIFLLLILLSLTVSSQTVKYEVVTDSVLNVYGGYDTRTYTKKIIIPLPKPIVQAERLDTANIPYAEEYEGEDCVYLCGLDCFMVEVTGKPVFTIADLTKHDAKYRLKACVKSNHVVKIPHSHQYRYVEAVNLTILSSNNRINPKIMDLVATVKYVKGRNSTIKDMLKEGILIEIPPTK